MTTGDGGLSALHPWPLLALIKTEAKLPAALWRGPTGSMELKFMRTGGLSSAALDSWTLGWL